MKKALMHAHTAYHIKQFNMDNIRLLQDLGYQVDVATCFGDDDSALSPEALQQARQAFIDMGCNVIETASLRKIFDIPSLIKGYRQLKKAADINRYDLVHTQSPIGGVICRLAMKKARKKYGTKVIYAAHGFHFFAGAPKKNWLIFYNAEKYCSRFTDLLITINQEDYKNASERFFAKRVEYVPGAGVDTHKFVASADARERVRGELDIDRDTTVLLSVGELIKRKNHIEVLDALTKLKAEGYLADHSIKYLIAGRGRMDTELRQEIMDRGLSDIVIMLGFRSDVADIFAASDIYVFPSHQEGLPVALMEAMSVGMPCAVSRIRGNVDLIEEGKGGYFFDSKDSDTLVCAIKKLMCDSRDVLESMGETNKEIMTGFDKDTVNACMSQLYQSIDEN